MKGALAFLVLAAGAMGQPPTPAGPVGMPAPAIGSPNQAIPGKPEATKATQAARQPAARAAGAGPSYKDLKYGPLRPVQLPKLDASTLPNGIRLFLLEDHELPMVNGAALVRTGSLADPPDKVGLASLAVTVMRTGGAGRASADQVNERLDNAGGTIETSVTSSSASITFTCLGESAPAVLAIFKDVLTAPRFDENSIEQTRSQMRTGIAHRNDDPKAIAHRELSDILYGRDNAYGREQQYAGLGSVARSDLAAFHARYFFPKNTILAVRGDFQASEMKALLEKLFADWTAEQQQPPAFPKVTASPGDAPGLYLAVKKDTRKTAFAMGQLGGMLDDKDYAALTIMADILGGAFRGRIGQRLRTGAANPAAMTPVLARWEAGYDYPGLFEISGTVESVSAVDTIKAIREEVNRIRTNEVTEDELRASKESVINSLVFAFDTKAKTLGRLMGYQYYGYPADFIDRYQQALGAVTRADVLRVAKERLKPESFATVVVGDAGDFIPPLDSLGGAVRKIDLTVAAPKLETVKTDATSAERGKQMLERMEKAAGGEEKLAAVKDSLLVADYSVTGASKVTLVRHTERWIDPLHYREDNDIGGGTISAYFDGSYGWISVPGGSVALAGSSLQQMRGNAFRGYVLLLQGGKLPESQVNAIDDRTMEIRRGADSVRVELDAETNLPARIRYEGISASGARPVTEETWTDYREVGGIKVPFQILIMENGRKYADVKVTDFKVNSGLKLSDLEKRP